MTKLDDLVSMYKKQHPKVEPPEKGDAKSEAIREAKQRA